MKCLYDRDRDCPLIPEEPHTLISLKAEQCMACALTRLAKALEEAKQP